MSVSSRLAALALTCLVAGCSSGSEPASRDTAGSAPPAKTAPAASTRDSGRTLSEMDFRRGMQRAGLELTELDKTYVTASDRQKFPAEPRRMLSVKVSDAEGNSTSMTLVQFGSANEAARMRGVNGFPVHNWFVLGIVSNHFRDKIVGAMG